MVDVEWLVDVALWQGSTGSIDLTDEEAWRSPVAAYRALTVEGAWRGHGLPVPLLLGSGAAPNGGVHGRGDPDGLARGRMLGIELVPEIDLPGHCFAALAVVPDLRDPADTSPGP